MRQMNTQVDELAKQKADKGDSVGPRLLGAEAALRVVAEQLPKIVPNMLINKRDGEAHLRHLCREAGLGLCCTSISLLSM